MSNEFDDLDLYLGILRKFPLLTRAEQRFLATRARNGDAAARQKMVRHNLALVVAIALKQGRGGIAAAAATRSSG